MRVFSCVVCGHQVERGDDEPEPTGWVRTHYAIGKKKIATALYCSAAHAQVDAKHRKLRVVP